MGCARRACPMMSAQGPGRGLQDGMVVVLQQEPTAPAFLLTLDTQKRMLTVRRVSATPETGRSYELWVISRRSRAHGRSGSWGSDEFTFSARFREFRRQHVALADELHAVSLEPAGELDHWPRKPAPILFTGKAVETLPATPKT